MAVTGWGDARSALQHKLITGVPLVLYQDWSYKLLTVVLMQGITEEIMFRGYIFGHLRPGRLKLGPGDIAGLLFIESTKNLPLLLPDSIFDDLLDHPEAYARVLNV